MKSIKELEQEYRALPEDGYRAYADALGPDERAAAVKLRDKALRRAQAYEAERERTYEMYRYERAQREAGAELICGIDEVGRGPLAGPVVACAVILPQDCGLLYLNDSKKLSEKKREELYGRILAEALSVGIGRREPGRIDEINILQATYEAMRDAIAALDPQPDVTLNDAVTIPGVDLPQVPIVKGDAKSATIAAASIVAKVTRDRYMREMDAVYPGYGFAENKGYGAQAHIDALRRLGPTPIHRRSFIGNFVRV